ncbi:MAG: transglutaminase-like domain-containing protein [Campylobacterota bacterium]|nr:transglutaminase-like domain-containing protein [Campylobacterota bacterium]
MKSEIAHKIALFIIVIALIYFFYMVAQAIGIVNKTQVRTSDGIYKSYVTSSEEIQEKAETLTRACESKLCKVQALLNFASNIPYVTNRFQQKSPQKTIEENFGDCDDKSNLLISMLHALEIEAYFVLVPKHIFVVVPLVDKRLSSKKGLWVNGRKHYILESTAKDSLVGYPLRHTLDEIDVIVEPFSNKKIDIRKLEYKP